MSGEVGTAGDDDDRGGLRQPLHVAAVLRRSKRLDVLADRGEETVLQLGTRFNFRQSGKQRPGLAVTGPCIAARRAVFDVLMRALPLLGVKRLRQQQRHTFCNQIAVRHR